MRRLLHKDIVEAFRWTGLNSILAHLEFIADADKAEFASFLLDIFGVDGVLKEFSYEPVFRLAYKTLQRHVQSIIILLHKLTLRER